MRAHRTIGISIDRIVKLTREMERLLAVVESRSASAAYTAALSAGWR